MAETCVDNLKAVTWLTSGRSSEIVGAIGRSAKSWLNTLTSKIDIEVAPAHHFGAVKKWSRKFLTALAGKGFLEVVSE